MAGDQFVIDEGAGVEERPVGEIRTVVVVVAVGIGGGGNLVVAKGLPGLELGVETFHAVGGLRTASEELVDLGLDPRDVTHQSFADLLGLLRKQPRVRAQRLLELGLGALEAKLRANLRHLTRDAPHALETNLVNLLGGDVHGGVEPDQVPIRFEPARILSQSHLLGSLGPVVAGNRRGQSGDRGRDLCFHKCVDGTQEFRPIRLRQGSEARRLRPEGTGLARRRKGLQESIDLIEFGLRDPNPLRGLGLHIRDDRVRECGHLGQPREVSISIGRHGQGQRAEDLADSAEGRQVGRHLEAVEEALRSVDRAV